MQPINFSRRHLWKKIIWFNNWQIIRMQNLHKSKFYSLNFGKEVLQRPSQEVLQRPSQIRTSASIYSSLQQNNNRIVSKIILILRLTLSPNSFLNSSIVINVSTDQSPKMGEEGIFPHQYWQWEFQVQYCRSKTLNPHWSGFCVP